MAGFVMRTKILIKTRRMINGTMAWIDWAAAAFNSAHHETIKTTTQPSAQLQMDLCRKLCKFAWFLESFFIQAIESVDNGWCIRRTILVIFSHPALHSILKLKGLKW